MHVSVVYGFVLNYHGICSSKRVCHAREQWENAQTSLNNLNKNNLAEIENAVKLVLFAGVADLVQPSYYNFGIS